MAEAGGIGGRAEEEASADGSSVGSSAAGSSSWFSRPSDRLDPFTEEYEALASVLFGDSHTLTFDSDGRVSLPEALLHHAQIDKAVCFVGMGSKFRIWNPEAYADYRAKARARALEDRSLLKSLSVPPPGGSSQ